MKSKKNKIYSTLTDIAHIAIGLIAGYTSYTDTAQSIFYTSLYILYQIIEHIIIKDDDLVSDIREYLIGYSCGLACTFIKNYISR